MIDDGTRASSSSASSNATGAPLRLEIVGAQKGSKEPSGQSVAFISAQRLVPFGYELDEGSTTTSSSSGSTTSKASHHHRSSRIGSTAESPAFALSLATTPHPPDHSVSNHHHEDDHDGTNQRSSEGTGLITTQRQDLCPLSFRPPSSQSSDRTPTNLEQGSLSAVHELRDSKLDASSTSAVPIPAPRPQLIGSPEVPRTRASDRSEKLQQDEIGGDDTVHPASHQATKARGIRPSVPQTSRDSSTGLAAPLTDAVEDDVDNASTNLDDDNDNEARGSFSSTTQQQYSLLAVDVVQGSDQTHADDSGGEHALRNIGKEQDSPGPSHSVEQHRSSGNVNTHFIKTIIITSPEPATSGPTILTSSASASLHVPERDDRQFQQSPHHYPSEPQLPYRFETHTGTNDRLADSGHVEERDASVGITRPSLATHLSVDDSLQPPPRPSSSTSTSSASLAQSSGVAYQLESQDSTDPDVQGGGMNEGQGGQGLAAEPSRGLRGYGEPPGPDYAQVRPYSGNPRAGIDQTIPYGVSTGIQDTQGIVRKDYDGSQFGRYPFDDRASGEIKGISNEPLKTKIKPKGRGKRKAEQVVQAEVETGGIPNAVHPLSQRDAIGLNTDSLGSSRNMEVQINQDYVAGNAPPTYDDYTYPANGLPSSTSYDPAQGFSSPSGQPPIFPPPSNGAHHLPRASFSAAGPSGQSMDSSPPAQRPHDRVPGGSSYNAMAGPSNPYLQGLPPAIQSQMPGGADYPSLPVGVSGGKIFKCMGFSGCEMTFTRSEHLARHVRKHTGERPFPCHCGKAFSRLDNLRQHAATVHNDSVDLNDRMLRALAPVHAALSQRAGKEQRQRGEVLSVPKTAAERAKSVQPKKPKRIPRGILGDPHAGPGHLQILHPSHHFGPDMPPPPPVLIPGQPGFHLQHPISSSIMSNPDMGPNYPPHMVPSPVGGPLHGGPLGTSQAHQPHPPPWIPPRTGDSQRPESSYRPGTDGRPGTGYASQHTSAGVSPHLPNPSHPSALSGYGHYGRSPLEPNPPAGFQYEPFPHGIRPGSKHPVSLQLQHPPRSAGLAMGGHSAPSVDHRFSDRSGTATSPYLQIPSLTSAPPYAPSYAQVQPPSAGTQLSFSPHPTRSSHPADMYQHLPGTAPSTGRPGTGILQHQQQQHPSTMQLHSAPYQSSHGSSGHSSRLTGNSSQHSLGQVTHQQIQEIYGNSGATQESPFSYHPPPTATQPPPPAQYTFGTVMPDYNIQPHGYHSDMDGRKRKTEELDPDAYDMDRRKGQKTELGKVAAGVFYPGRTERRSSLAISSLISGDGQSQVQPSQDPTAPGPDYGHGYYEHNGDPGLADQNNMANFTFGSVSGPEYSYGPGGHPSYILEEQQQQAPHAEDIKPGHHAMHVKARALLDNGGYDL